MKIIIITVYKSLNFGSYLQSKQLQKSALKYGEVCFFDAHTRKMGPPFLRKIKRIIKDSPSNINIIKGIIFEIKELISLHKCWNSLGSSQSLDKFDVVILGSDEIWNIERPSCRNPIYWGKNIDAFKISYAPSVNNASEKALINNPEYINYLNGIDRVSVRDRHSMEVLRQFLPEKPLIVLDPTLLQKPDHIDFNLKKPFIALYLFTNTLSEDDIKHIINFSKEKDMPLISAGQYISWCDGSVHSFEGNPFYIFENASYVITNTFHGTAYAINYNTAFVSFAKGKTKIFELLDQFGLGDRIVDDSSDLCKTMAQEIDYANVNFIMKKWRDESLKYIDESIKQYVDTVNINENNKGKFM